MLALYSLPPAAAGSTTRAQASSRPARPGIAPVRRLAASRAPVSRAGPVKEAADASGNGTNGKSNGNGNGNGSGKVPNGQVRCPRALQSLHACPVTCSRCAT